MKGVFTEDLDLRCQVQVDEESRKTQSLGHAVKLKWIINRQAQEVTDTPGVYTLAFNTLTQLPNIRRFSAHDPLLSPLGNPSIHGMVA
ncbi:hypothetical protein [Oceanithermus desulfurans]|uniref:Uncharacterized protein n=2 Tax=Oceanithermus desulfurans TaxID=227924 RepID=A0A511RJ41_9DEIN|nr:hypothetical protein [Oceanithermus desulfurans]MBB6029642.1 hypothetical protein [Oceanithermus desulfurans]GEM89663.1 hypothetical protein ODE01S_10970 [Oceanithermus desulfurans NBRC 100063]